MNGTANGLSLEGKRVIVTGGARGMAAAVVWAYTQAGARVASIDIAAQGAEQFDAEQKKRLLCVQGDVSDKASVAKAVGQAAEWMGGIDVLVNAAAIFPGNAAESIPVDEWDEVFAVNVRGTVLTNQA
jgi:NAD(P)-dependent dehydrogenase (short-subunit alcohol dehydrogenase family)